jgi:hypothetical protein
MSRRVSITYVAYSNLPVLGFAVKADAAHPALLPVVPLRRDGVVAAHLADAELLLCLPRLGRSVLAPAAHAVLPVAPCGGTHRVAVRAGDHSLITRCRRRNGGVLVELLHLVHRRNLHAEHLLLLLPPLEVGGDRRNRLGLLVVEPEDEVVPDLGRPPASKLRLREDGDDAEIRPEETELGGREVAEEDVVRIRLDERREDAVRALREDDRRDHEVAPAREEIVEELLALHRRPKDIIQDDECVRAVFPCA